MKKNERISNVFGILGARSAEKSEGIMGANTFDPNILFKRVSKNLICEADFHGFLPVSIRGAEQIHKFEGKEAVI